VGDFQILKKAVKLKIPEALPSGRVVHTAKLCSEGRPLMLREALAGFLPPKTP
jgi:hypothetical protein